MLTAGITQKNRQTPEGQRISPPLPLGPVMSPAVEQIALHGPQVLLPLLLQVDERPLPAAESEVLEAGEGEKLLLTVSGHPMRVQVTPAGRADSSTVTV